MIFAYSVVPVTDRKRRKRAKDLCRKQGRLERRVPTGQEGPQRGPNTKGNRTQNHRRRIPVQVHGVQRPHATGPERSV